MVGTCTVLYGSDIYCASSIPNVYLEYVMKLMKAYPFQCCLINKK